MKVLLGAALVLLVLYLISGSAVTSVISLGGSDGNVSVGGRRLGPSMFAITFRDQYLCDSFEHGAYVTSDRDTGEGCTGPYFDSVNLCRRLEEVGQSRVRLYFEGRMLECDHEGADGGEPGS
jgi:hypothetical protein